MKFNVLVILVQIGILMGNVCNAQVIDNKFNLQIGYSAGKFLGEEFTEIENFIPCSFFTNFNDLRGIHVSGLYKSSQLISFGLGFDLLQTGEWSVQKVLYLPAYSSSINLDEKDKSPIWLHYDFGDITNPEIALLSISPTFQLHNAYKETGFFNRAKLYLEIGPTIGMSHVKYLQRTTEDAPYYCNDYGYCYYSAISNDNDTEVKSKDIFVGIKGNAGIEYTVSKSIGLFLKYTIQHNRIKSDYYQNKQFSNTSLILGLNFRLYTNKRYYY